MGLGIVRFYFEKFKLLSALFSFSSQYKFNQTENPVNIKSIINIYNPHTLKIPSITKMWMISSEQPARPGVICMPHKASACQTPVLFSSPHACLFSVQIKYRSFVLVEDRCFFIPPPRARARIPHTEAVLTPSADGDSLLKRKSSQYDWSLLGGGALFSSSILQGIFVSRHCEIRFFFLFVCSRVFCSL